MDSSVSLALIVATLASLWSTLKGGGDTYYDSVTMFVFFLLLARFVERRLRDADLIALARLEDGLPEFVTALREGNWTRTPRDQVLVGDRLRVAAGEAIAFDGEIADGKSAVEESVFTGESVPRTVAPGDAVYAGTVNREATLDINITSSYRDSRLAALANDVERARGEKPPYLQLIDRIAARFVAFILFAATATFLAWLAIDSSRAVWSALAVLVVACPCALSLATPAAIASATAWLRKRGIMVRGEFGLLAAADADTVLIDKTGTLTETRLAIDNIVLATARTELADPDTAREYILSLAAGLQQVSSHPAARPFHTLQAAPGIERVQVVAGAGMTGFIAGSPAEATQLRLGSLDHCRALAPDLPDPPDDSHYWIALVDDHGWLAWIGLSETLRTGASGTIAQLKSLGLSVELLSGDSEARVRNIASQLDIPFRGALSPGDKLVTMQNLQRQNHCVIAIGDGLNDAPLLTAADASIAVAGATALAQTQADFVVLEDDLQRVTTIVNAARAARRIMRQNLWWAAGYNLLGIPFAALGYVPPWVAAIGMSLSSLIVVLNALRLRRLRS